MKIYKDIFNRIISAENLFSAWEAFKKGKGKRRDVLEFESNLEGHIFKLHRELRAKTYKHGAYSSFYITDPKQRHIHKATVRDRIVHHAIFSVINPIFEETFIPTSFSCRIGFGTHKGVGALTRMIRTVSQNNTRPCFVLKCDVRKFFDSIDHKTLLAIFEQRIKDKEAMQLLTVIVDSFSISLSERTERERETNALKGVPIGNLTSQLFANVYMNEFDQFVKQDLKVKHYARYTDDFIIASGNVAYLERLLPSIKSFLKEKLSLELHSKKVGIYKLHRGIDFLGYIVFPHHRLLRTKTKRRMLKKYASRLRSLCADKISKEKLKSALVSYLGVLRHANGYKISENLKNQYWFFN